MSRTGALMVLLQAIARERAIILTSELRRQSTLYASFVSAIRPRPLVIRSGRGHHCLLRAPARRSRSPRSLPTAPRPLPVHRRTGVEQQPSDRGMVPVRRDDREPSAAQMSGGALNSRSRTATDAPWASSTGPRRAILPSPRRAAPSFRSIHRRVGSNRSGASLRGPSIVALRGAEERPVVLGSDRVEETVGVEHGERRRLFAAAAHGHEAINLGYLAGAPCASSHTATSRLPFNSATA